MVKKTDDAEKISERAEVRKTTPRVKLLTKAELEQALLNNFINLQKVLTNLSIKFDALSDNISKLLQLFEISAKSFAERYSEEEERVESGGEKQLLEKLNSLFDQNKTIAKGIMLMEERMRERNAPTQMTRDSDSRFHGMLRTKPMPRY